MTSSPGSPLLSTCNGEENSLQIKKQKTLDSSRQGETSSSVVFRDVPLFSVTYDNFNSCSKSCLKRKILSLEKECQFTDDKRESIFAVCFDKDGSIWLHPIIQWASCLSASCPVVVAYLPSCEVV